jgi:uncharacterized protein
LSYAAHTGSQRHREAATGALGVVGALADRAPRFIGWGLAVAEALLDGPREVAVVGRPDAPDTAALHRAALLGTAPGAVVAAGPATDDGFPLLRDRTPATPQATAYVCRDFTCALPVTTPEALKSQLT